MRSSHLMIFPSVALLVLVGFFTVTTHPSTQTQKPIPDNVKVRNKTSGYEVLDAKMEGTRMSISLRNNYQQKITATVLSFGPTSSVRGDWAFAEDSDGLASGEKREENFYFSLPLKPRYDVTVEAVVLEDGTGDGDPLFYQDIMETRVGYAIQCKRTLKLLRSPSKAVAAQEDQVSRLRLELATVLAAPETETVAEMVRMRPAGFVNRYSDADSLLPGGVQLGLGNGAQDILRRIDELDRRKPLNESLLRLTRFCENSLNKVKLPNVSP
ncbi:MAG TPA: hypothetical protein VFZ22_10810 [Pyrinomonadaceae bacterium]|nr:hypothetical protein [Pyrinomonadaceae bacterium]